MQVFGVFVYTETWLSAGISDNDISVKVLLILKTHSGVIEMFALEG